MEPGATFLKTGVESEQSQFSNAGARAELRALFFSAPAFLVFVGKYLLGVTKVVIRHSPPPRKLSVFLLQMPGTFCELEC